MENIEGVQDGLKDENAARDKSHDDAFAARCLQSLAVTEDLFLYQNSNATDLRQLMPEVSLGTKLVSVVAEKNITSTQRSTHSVRVEQMVTIFR